MERVIFLCRGANRFFQYNDIIYCADSRTMAVLKEQLTLPYELVFKEYSRAEVGRVISDFMGEDTNIRFGNFYGHFKVTFTEKNYERHH